ncbi:hypothetical protein Ahy_A01g003457 [Arachis hypogaea]|uniref:NAC domain-containing protein n=1 Tax=Arachis hypogaea TaxID=3818 RepID=A0A445ETD6_ARAHY|nr:NAC domain-containing protein 71-like [Arachis hypogaea]RYR78616.1 hypothetical protein Ahy_A01g003457 [Arachis hypogaea]
MTETTILPVGYRFRPTEELLVHYLNNKHLRNDAQIKNTVSQIDLYNFDPWDLPEQSKVKWDDQEWFFFNELKHIKNKRCNRKTNAGYWKITGKERIVKRTGIDNINIVLSRVIKNVEKREKKVKRKASNIIEEEACVSSEPQAPQDVDYEILSSEQQSSVAHSGNGSNNSPLLPFECMWKQDVEMNTECFWNLLFSSIDADLDAEFLNSVLAGND